MHLKIQDDNIELDGKDIGDHVVGLELRMQPGQTEVILTMSNLEISAAVEVDLLNLEKQGHAKFKGLNGETRFVRIS